MEGEIKKSKRQKGNSSFLPFFFGIVAGSGFFKMWKSYRQIENQPPRPQGHPSGTAVKKKVFKLVLILDTWEGGDFFTHILEKPTFTNRKN